MIQFGFRSPSKNEISLEKEKELEQIVLEKFGDFKKEFEDVETYIDYNVDNGLYTFRCEKNFSDIMGRFQQYQIERNQSDSNLTSPSSDIAP